jgi:hypothetical protein
MTGEAWMVRMTRYDLVSAGTARDAGMSEVGDALCIRALGMVDMSEYVHPLNWLPLHFSILQPQTTARKSRAARAWPAIQQDHPARELSAHGNAKTTCAGSWQACSHDMIRGEGVRRPRTPPHLARIESCE